MNRRWKMIGSFPVTFTERQASQFKITVFYFYPARVLKVLSRSPAPSSGLSSPNRPIIMKDNRNLNLQVLLNFLIQILSKYERSKNASRAKKINTSQNLSRLNLSTYNYFIANFGNNKHEINRKVMILFQLFWNLSVFESYINNCDRHFSWKPLKKHSKQKTIRIRQF